MSNDTAPTPSYDWGPYKIECSRDDAGAEICAVWKGNERVFASTSWHEAQGYIRQKRPLPETAP